MKLSKSGVIATVILLCTCVFLVFRINFVNNVNVLFLSYDLGDANAFMPIAAKLAENNISYRVIALGKAQEIFKNNTHLIPLPTAFDNQAFIQHRQKTLSPNELTSLTEGISPKVIISGMSSAALSQLLNYYILPQDVKQFFLNSYSHNL